MAGAGREKRVETCTLFNSHYHDKPVKMQQVFVKKKVLKNPVKNFEETTCVQHVNT